MYIFINHNTCLFKLFHLHIYLLLHIYLFMRKEKKERKDILCANCLKAYLHSHTFFLLVII